MAKDARGHGSEGRGPHPWQRVQGSNGRGPQPHSEGEVRLWDNSPHIDAAKTSYSGDASGNLNSPLVSNATAARELASGPKSEAAPAHDSMMSGMGGPPPVRSADSQREYDEYNRDLKLRSRNGQVGSGMKFRG